MSSLTKAFFLPLEDGSVKILVAVLSGKKLSRSVINQYNTSSQLTAIRLANELIFELKMDV